MKSMCCGKVGSSLGTTFMSHKGRIRQHSPQAHRRYMSQGMQLMTTTIYVKTPYIYIHPTLGRGLKHHVNTRILHSGCSAQDEGIPETTVCGILCLSCVLAVNNINISITINNDNNNNNSDFSSEEQHSEPVPGSCKMGRQFGCCLFGASMGICWPGQPSADCLALIVFLLSLLQTCLSSWVALQGCKVVRAISGT